MASDSKYLLQNKINAHFVSLKQIFSHSHGRDYSVEID